VLIETSTTREIERSEEFSQSSPSICTRFATGKLRHSLAYVEVVSPWCDVQCPSVVLTQSAVVAILAIAAAAGAATAPGPGLSKATGWCGVTAFRDPILNSDDGRFASSVTTPTATGVRFEGSCGVFDLFNFGPDASQLYSGQSFGFGMGFADPGVLRVYAVATAIVDPSKYDFGVVGVSPYRARTVFGTSASFADVFVPPPVSSAPHAGDPTTLRAAIHLDCFENAQADVVSSGIAVSAYTPEAYAADLEAYDSIYVTTRTFPHTPCPIFFEPYKAFQVIVGTPVVLLFSVGVSADTTLMNFQYGGTTIFSDALNTGTLVVTNADDVPLTGQSGKLYAQPGALPTVTTSSTVTSTTSEPPTTTTLAGCAGTCGDGTVDTACGETCECTPTADPVQAAYGCDGGAVVPPQDDCMTCRGCRLLPVRCEVAVTTTTVVGATTTTSVAGGTTTTTLPSACAGLAGIAAAGCSIDAFLAEPLCLDAPAKAKVEAGFRRTLGAVRKALTRALTATDKKRRRLLGAADKKLGAVGRRAAALGRKEKISGACAARIVALVESATNLLDD
jgi:hypothetical protein